MHNALAAGLLESAQKFELAGNTKGALILYRDIVKSYAGTDAAAKAAKQIEALGGKR